MKIEILRENEPGSNKLYTRGDIVSIWEEPYLISQIDYDMYNLISLYNGNRVDDPKSRIDYQELEKLNSDGLTTGELSYIFEANVEDVGNVSLRIQQLEEWK